MESVKLIRPPRGVAVDGRLQARALDRENSVDLTTTERSVSLQSAVNSEFYYAIYEDVRLAKVPAHVHYERWGWREGRDPAPGFSTSAYLRAHPELAASTEPPLLHALRIGAKPVPSAYAKPFARRQAALARGPIPATRPFLTDLEIVGTELRSAYYRVQCEARGLSAPEENLVVHYFRSGARLGLNPNPNFSTNDYLRLHPDVARSGANPFLHWLRSGRAEGRLAKKPNQPAAQSKASDRKDSPPAESLERARAAFDSGYYLEAYPDVAKAGMDPFAHYLAAGWREGRDPSPYFSSRRYLDANPDVQASGRNPLVHYVEEGRAQGRVARPSRDFRTDIISTLRPFEWRVSEQRRSAPAVALGTAEGLRQALDEDSRTALRKLYVSWSHDNYTESLGGVQLCLLREAEAVRALGLDHLHLFPGVPITKVQDPETDAPLGVILNGRLLGYYTIEAIVGGLTAYAPLIERCEFVVHSLLGHHERALLEIASILNCERGFFWVHDFASVCAGFTLLRNDVQFCGAPPPDSLACSICTYGKARARNMEAHRALFEQLRLTVVVPSKAAAKVWESGTDVPHAGVHVHPHCTLMAREAQRELVESGERPLRVAFLGQPATHKGWPVFRDLVLQVGDDSRFEFHHLGMAPGGLPVAFEQTVVSDCDLEAMRATLERLEIDVALIWSICPETFCFTAFEAAAAGAFILTFKDSGNVVDFVRTQGSGLVLDSYEELLRLFQSGDLVRETRKAGGKRKYDLSYSRMTVDLL